jgi:hypothetical protein
VRLRLPVVLVDSRSRSFYWLPTYLESRAASSIPSAANHIALPAAFASTARIYLLLHGVRASIYPPASACFDAFLAAA